MVIDVPGVKLKSVWVCGPGRMLTAVLGRHVSLWILINGGVGEETAFFMAAEVFGSETVEDSGRGPTEPPLYYDDMKPPITVCVRAAVHM